jgi:hypothetical protein
MQTFTKPSNLNGAELRAELNAAGVNITDDLDAVTLDENNNLCLKIAQKDVEKATQVVSNHNGNVIAPSLTIEQKLATVGLSIADLRAALLS